MSKRKVYVRKPKELSCVGAECLSGDSVLEAAPIIQISATEIYSAKEARKLSRWLVGAAKWLKKEEEKP